MNTRSDYVIAAGLAIAVGLGVAAWLTLATTPARGEPMKCPTSSNCLPGRVWKTSCSKPPCLAIMPATPENQGPVWETMPGPNTTLEIGRVDMSTYRPLPPEFWANPGLYCQIIEEHERDNGVSDPTTQILLPFDEHGLLGFLVCQEGQPPHLAARAGI